MGCLRDPTLETLSGFRERRQCVMSLEPHGRAERRDGILPGGGLDVAEAQESDDLQPNQGWGWG